MKKVLTAAIIIVLIGLYGYLSVIRPRNQADNANLTKDVYDAVEQKTNGVWDKKINVLNYGKFHTVAKGTWLAKDHWGWIAWRKEAGLWEVLVSLDGFDCEELKGVPAELEEFFYETTHSPSGEVYCYSHKIPNKVDFMSKVAFADPEKDQVIKSVDAFMNEYKLPKGVQNSYALSVEKRLNDALQVVTNLEQTESDFHATIYLRKIDGVWQVDPNAGPWCTLEQFEQRDC